MPIDLTSLFGDPDKRPANARALMGDDFATGFRIFGLPEGFEAEHFARHFTDRVYDLELHMPPTICLQGKAILRNTGDGDDAGEETETTLTEIIFREPIDVDIVSKLLLEAIQQGLEDQGIPDPDDGYMMESVDADYEESLGRLLGNKGGGAPSGWRPGL